MSITVTPTIPFPTKGSTKGIFFVVIDFMCLAPVVPTTSESFKPNTVTQTATGTTTLAPFTGAAAVKQMAIGPLGIVAGAVVGVLL